MRLRDFIRWQRTAIDAYIAAIPGTVPPKNDKEREDWVRNDEQLYNNARYCGVPTGGRSSL